MYLITITISVDTDDFISVANFANETVRNIKLNQPTQLLLPVQTSVMSISKVIENLNRKDDIA